MSLIARLNRLEATMPNPADAPALVLCQPGETAQEARARAGAPDNAEVFDCPAKLLSRYMPGGCEVYPRAEPLPPREYTPAEAYAAMCGGA